MNTFVSAYLEALEEDNEKHLWEFYLRMVDRMDKNNFKSFEEWKSDLKKEKKMEEIKPMSKKEKSALCYHQIELGHALYPIQVDFQKVSIAHGFTGWVIFTQYTMDVFLGHFDF